MMVQVDRNIYSDTCISKCVYSLSGKIECKRMLNGNTETIELFSCREEINEDEIRQLFQQRLNDYKLREIIARDTKDIRTILYAKAFADCEDFSLEDVE